MKKILLVVAMLAILLMTGCNKNENVEKNNVQENQNNQQQGQLEKNIEIVLGLYTVNEIQVDEAGVSNDDCGLELKDDDLFIIYMGWGAWHSGKYDIENDILKCYSTKLEWDGGAGPGSRATDVVFSFRIIDNNKLELISIDINDSDRDKLIYDEGLKIGMTYSKK